MNVYVMCGLPGAGKSSWIKQNLRSNIIVVSRDNIRHELGFTSSPEEKVKLTKEQEALVTDYEYNKMEQLVMDDKDFVVDDTNIGGYRKKMINFLRGLSDDINIIGINLKTPLSVCKKRRSGQISEEAMDLMASKLQYITKDEVDELLNVT